MPRWTKLARTLLVTVAPASVRQVLGVAEGTELAPHPRPGPHFGAPPRAAGLPLLAHVSPAILRKPRDSPPARLAQQVSRHIDTLARAHTLLEPPSTPQARLAVREAALGLRVFVELYPSGEKSLGRGLRKLASALRPVSTCDRSTLRLVAWHARTLDPTLRAVLELLLDRTEASTRSALYEARHRLQDWTGGPPLRAALLDHLDRTTGRMLRMPLDEADVAPRIEAYIDRTVAKRSSKGLSDQGLGWRLQHAMALLGSTPPQLETWLDASLALGPLGALRSTTDELRRTLSPLCVSLHEGLGHLDRELSRQHDEALACLRDGRNAMQHLGALGAA